MTNVITAAGFVLMLSHGGHPVNHAPMHVFENQEMCNADLETWKRIAPEWKGECQEVKATPMPMGKSK